MIEGSLGKNNMLSGTHHSNQPKRGGKKKQGRVGKQAVQGGSANRKYTQLTFEPKRIPKTTQKSQGKQIQPKEGPKIPSPPEIITRYNELQSRNCLYVQDPDRDYEKVPEGGWKRTRPKSLEEQLKEVKLRSIQPSPEAPPLELNGKGGLSLPKIAKPQPPTLTQQLNEVKLKPKFPKGSLPNVTFVEPKQTTVTEEPEPEPRWIEVDHVSREPTLVDGIYKCCYKFKKTLISSIFSVPAALGSLGGSTYIQDVLETRCLELDEKIRMCEPQSYPVVMEKDVEVSDGLMSVVPKLLVGSNTVTITPEMAYNCKGLDKWLTDSRHGVQGAPRRMPVDMKLMEQAMIPKLLSLPPNREVFNQRLDQVSNTLDFNNDKRDKYMDILNTVGYNVVSDSMMLTGMNLRIARQKQSDLQDFLRNH